VQTSTRCMRMYLIKLIKIIIRSSFFLFIKNLFILSSIIYFIEINLSIIPFQLISLWNICDIKYSNHPIIEIVLHRRWKTCHARLPPPQINTELSYRSPYVKTQLSGRSARQRGRIMSGGALVDRAINHRAPKSDEIDATKRE